MKKGGLVALALALTLCGVVGARVKDLRKRAVNGIIPLSDGNYSSTILSGPRNYDALVLFTVHSKKYKCTACQDAERSLDALQYSMTADSAYGNASVLAGAKPLLIFSCNHEGCQSPFGLYGMRNAPSLAFFPSTRKRHGPPRARSSLDPATSISPSGPHGPKDILRIMAGTRPPVPLRLRPKTRLPHAIAAAVGMALVAMWVGGDPSRLAFWRHKSAWLAGSLLVFGGGVSGLVYCVIRSPPLMGLDDKGRPAVFSGGGRDQYVVEGVFIGVLTLAAAASVIALVLAAKAGRGDIANTSSGVFLLALAAGLFLRLLQLYRSKTSWYDPGQQLPPGLMPAAQHGWAWLDDRAQQHLGVALQDIPGHMGVPDDVPLLPPALKL